MQDIRAQYDLFGLAVASELALPLPPSSSPAQVAVVLGPVSVDGVPLFETDDPLPFACYRRGEAIVLTWTGVRFAVLPHRVVVDADDPLLAAHLLVPAVWSVVLAAHRRESLHGAAVEHGGHGAVAFLGCSGSGKTTAARRLIDHGWRLLSDDLLTFDARMRVVPGPPWMRLLPGLGNPGPGTADLGGKRRVHMETSSKPVPLAAMVVMAPEHERCVRLTGTSAVAALLQQIYNPVLTHPDQAQRRFDLVHTLVDRIPIYGAPPRSLSANQVLRIGEEATA